MGTVLGKTDSRRISFDNSCSLMASALAVDKISDEHGKSSNNVVKRNEPRFNEKTEFFNDPDNYWSRRLESLKKEHWTINKTVEREFENKLESTNKIFDRPPMTPEKVKKLKYCLELRKKVIECYANNPKRTLSCSPNVRAFLKAVSQCQQEVDEIKKK